MPHHAPTSFRAHTSFAARRPATALPRWLLATSLMLMGGAVWCGSARAADLPGPGDAVRLDDSALAAVHGAGLDTAALQTLGLQAGALQAVAMSASPATDPNADTLRRLQDATQIERQALQLYGFAATTGTQASLQSAVLAQTLAGLSAASLALPVMIPVIGLPLLGLLPMLPNLPQKKGS